MDDVVIGAVKDIADRDWDALRFKLHPYLHWTSGTGAVVRGRKNVLRLLEAGPAPGPPSSYELRDGQIYRWHA